MVHSMILKQVLQLGRIFSRCHLDYQNIILYIGNKYACVCVCVIGGEKMCYLFKFEVQKYVHQACGLHLDII